MQESDMESKSLSQDSFDYSDGMCGENFNTLKKGPGWGDIDGKLEVEVDDVTELAIKPPPEFQDSPSPPDSDISSSGFCYRDMMYRKVPRFIDELAENLVQMIVEEALVISCRISWPEGRIQPSASSIMLRRSPRCSSTARHLWSTDLYPTPAMCHQATITLTPYSTLNRPNSRSSLASRLSSSHNSINTTGLSHKADDSSFITSAMSHDVLTSSEISDMYNVPFDSDIYTVPIDFVRPLQDFRNPQRPKRHRHHRKRRRNTSSASSQNEFEMHIQQARHYCSKPRVVTHVIKSQRLVSDVCCNEAPNGKRHSVPGTSGRHTTRSSNSQTHNIGEPIHMTLHEVRQYLQTLYSSSGESRECKMKREKMQACQTPIHLALPKGISVNNNNRYSTPHDSSVDTPVSIKSGNGLIHNNNNNNTGKKHKKNTLISIKNKKSRDEGHKEKADTEREKIKKSQRNFSLNLKQTLCNIFRFRKLGSPDHFINKRNSIVHGDEIVEEDELDSDQHVNNNNTTSEVDVPPHKLPFFKRALPPLPRSNGHIRVGTDDSFDDGDGEKLNGIGEGGECVEQGEDALTTMVSKCDSPNSVQHLNTPVSRLDEDAAEDTSMDFAASIEKVKDVSCIFFVKVYLLFLISNFD